MFKPERKGETKESDQISCLQHLPCTYIPLPFTLSFLTYACEQQRPSGSTWNRIKNIVHGMQRNTKKMVHLCISPSAESICDCLRRSYVWAPGSLDAQNHPVLFFPDITEDSLPFPVLDLLLDYFFQSFCRHVFAIDRRRCGWVSVRMLLMHLNLNYIDQIEYVIVLRPQGFFQRIASDKFVTGIYNDVLYSLHLIDEPKELFEFISPTQIPSLLGGDLSFDISSWVNFQISIFYYSIIVFLHKPQSNSIVCDSSTLETSCVIVFIYYPRLQGPTHSNAPFKCNSRIKKNYLRRSNCTTFLTKVNSFRALLTTLANHSKAKICLFTYQTQFFSWCGLGAIKLVEVWLFNLITCNVPNPTFKGQRCSHKPLNGYSVGVANDYQPVVICNNNCFMASPYIADRTIALRFFCVYGEGLVRNLIV
ncbi:Guanine nucleotide exchange factor DBS [Echinococcus granulosus]|uniref:Guanine nucleotide exchange factor DBS n=1 Tax=Echinococcus granulosus TaxID=6210 RepID=W6URR8_ECHGR|nr:Guanine nucleotide exchange factor DBS [Echinococcus granulosus]EUB63381.1 Guanine nucleotide exchange factor DBS [Echinococcus granulosus]